MRITFVASSMKCGGAERVLAAMANYWVERGKDITILTFDRKGAVPFYNLTGSVRLLPLGISSNSANISGSLKNNFKRLRVLRKAIKSSHPDVVISFLIRTNIRVLLATRGLRVPVIVSERSDPFLAQPGIMWRLLEKITYPFAARITTFTKQAANYFPSSLRKKVRVIPNPVDILKAKPSSQNETQRLVAVGRLEHVKGFDLLIRAFAIVRQHYPQATLTIWGEGSRRQELESLRDELNLSDQVLFPGITNDIASALSEADLFVQASRWEGFGNALCEAMAVGLPVISSACSGPQEIVRDGVDGVLVPVENVDALATAMLDLLTNTQKRRALATNAVEITRRFNLEGIMRRWDELLAEVITSPAGRANANLSSHYFI